MYTFLCRAHVVRQKFQTPDVKLSDLSKLCGVTHALI